MSAADFLLRPSASHQWLACAGSVAAQLGLPDESSEAAAFGTACHELAATLFVVEETGRSIADTLDTYTATNGVVLDAEDIKLVLGYVAMVRRIAAGAPIGAEVPVDARIYVPRVKGTADAIVYTEPELQVHDLKTGYVRVPPETPQLKLYALGALQLGEVSLALSVTHVHVFIHQVVHDSVPEAVYSVEELEAWARDVARPAAERAAKLYVWAALRLEGPEDNGEYSARLTTLDHWEALKEGEHCDYCKARPTCPAARRRVANVAGIEFDSAPPTTAPTVREPLSDAMAWADYVEKWAKAVRAEVERRLLSGTPVDGWKLVGGRKGARKWSDESDAEKRLKSMRLTVDELYDKSVKSPTQILKLERFSHRQRAKLDELITQADGRPSVAPQSDPRPAYVRPADTITFDTQEG